MYQPYPFSGPGPVPQPSAPPRTLVTAVTFMYVGAALCAFWLSAYWPGWAR